MQFFKPQLARFPLKTVEDTVKKLRPTVEDPSFWIEEKLDGERMQVHVVIDDSLPTGAQFAFWSR